MNGYWRAVRGGREDDPWKRTTCCCEAVRSRKRWWPASPARNPAAHCVDSSPPPTACSSRSSPIRSGWKALRSHAHHHLPLLLTHRNLPLPLPPPPPPLLLATLSTRLSSSSSSSSSWLPPPTSIASICAGWLSPAQSGKTSAAFFFDFFLFGQNFGVSAFSAQHFHSEVKIGRYIGLLSQQFDFLGQNFSFWVGFSGQYFDSEVKIGQYICFLSQHFGFWVKICTNFGFPGQNYGCKV